MRELAPQVTEGENYPSVTQACQLLLRQGQVLVAAGKKMINIGRGISSVGGTLFTWGFGVKFMK